eukprot:Skav236468  [mRNA]  locus=scaffold3359:13306:19529:+ [translate_table: standard]
MSVRSGLDVPHVLAACADFGQLLKSFAENRSEGLSVSLHLKNPGQCGHLQRGVVNFAPSLFSAEPQVQQLLQELDTVNGTIRALDEADPEGFSRDGQPRRLADAEDTVAFLGPSHAADVASLLCSPDSPPPLQDVKVSVSPKPPDSQQLFQVVPVPVEGEGLQEEAPVERPLLDTRDAICQPSTAPIRNLTAASKLNSKDRLGEEGGNFAPTGHAALQSRERSLVRKPTFLQRDIVPLEDVIESFSEDLVVQSQDAAFEHVEQHRDVGNESGPCNVGKQEISTEFSIVAARKSDPVEYRNVIDVTDEPMRSPVEAAMAIVPHEKAPVRPVAPRVPLNDALGRPVKRKRPAQLSQHLRVRPSQGVAASQRLCVNLARRRQTSRRGWVLSQDSRSCKKMSSVGQAASEKNDKHDKPNVLFTGFSRGDLHQLKQCVNRLGGSAVRDLPAGRAAAETRVVVRCKVTDGGHQIAGARTMKYLDAVLAGAWVLSADWVHKSLEAGHWLAEATFELQGDTAMMGGPSRGRHHGPELFYGFRFHFVAWTVTVTRCLGLSEVLLPDAEGPAPSELARLVRRAGAEVVDTLRTLPDAEEDPRHLADELLLPKRKRKRSSSSGKEHCGLPDFWWRKPIMITVPSKAQGTKGGRSLERAAKLANELGWVTLPSSWMLDCISCGEVCLPMRRTHD